MKKYLLVAVAAVILGAATAPADLRVVLRDKDGKAVTQITTAPDGFGGLAVLVPPGGWAAVEQVPAADPTTAPWKVDLAARHNAARAAVRVAPLAENPQLDAAAQGHADWMAAHERMDHNEPPGGPDFVHRIAARGYRWSTAGENVAAGQRDAAEVMGAWLGSRGHRANVENAAYKDAGYGMAKGKSGTAYWCVDFAAPGTFAATAGAAAGPVNLPGGIARQP